MEITLNAEIADNKEQKLPIGSKWKVIDEGEKIIQIKKIGRGNQPIVEVKRWILAKACSDIKSNRGGKRIASEGKKTGRPKISDDAKIRSIYCTDKEIQMLRKVLADSRKYNEIDNHISYKKQLKKYLELDIESKKITE